MKAVVYTDAWQIVVMFLSVIIIVICGTVDLDGFGAIFQIADEGKRLTFFKLEFFSVHLIRILTKILFFQFQP